MTKHIGIVIQDRGAAIVEVERSEDDALLCTAIARLPFDLGAVTERVRGLDPDARYTVDAEGLGTALWAVLGRPEDDEHWTLYEGRGLARQALVDELLVAVQEDRFRFAAGLEEQDAMSKALTSYRRVVRDDGLIGSELVVALLLALITPVPEPVFLVRFGGGLFDDRDDEADGSVIGGQVLRRLPDGSLVSVPDRKAP